MLKQITLVELKQMANTKGLILQGCDGDLQEWVDNINEHLTNEKVLLDGDTFKDALFFEYNGLTNLLFPIDNVKLNIGYLTGWMILTDYKLGGTWLNNYLTDKCGMDLNAAEPYQKPDCPLIGEDSNIFNLMDIASKTLKNQGMKAETKEMRDRIMDSGSYDEALCIIGEYVNITSADETENQGMGGIEL